MKIRRVKKRVMALFASLALAVGANMGLTGPIIEAPVTVYSYITINIS